MEEDDEGDFDQAGSEDEDSFESDFGEEDAEDEAVEEGDEEDEFDVEAYLKWRKEHPDSESENMPNLSKDKATKKATAEEENDDAYDDEEDD